ncbi:MAG: hypothetical protein ABR613_03095, partial [Actinomycetota bacterium]
AYRQRNIALAEAIFTSDSPMLPRVRREIDKLLDASVISETRFQPLSIDVVANYENEVEINLVQVLSPKFVTEGGDEVTTAKPVRERQESLWTLRVENGEWLLHNATITRILNVDRKRQ